ncbi:hypothetical protein J5N97_009121 [Dioscorea zingiberensis]|uniref:Alpha/beta hydrolase fold-3 domain-containing protein n=1 Tax=Dioscorea zingiberensis TaxID=325984 RepID=A0A9D5HLN8_9LILI|nr:hypothetical protein J5N97_009121 [Dioscorea zingiberensis]
MNPNSPEKKKKVVVEEVTNWLRLYDDGSVDRTWTGPAKDLPLFTPIPPYTTPVNNITVHDLQNTFPPFRLYLPELSDLDNSGNLPVFLHFHGGGFCISQPSWPIYHHFYSRLCRQTPAIIISPYLPLAPENRLPAAIDAAYSSLLWLRDVINSPEKGPVEYIRAVADFSRVFLIGDSSGGNLVHEVASRAGREADLDPIRITGAVMLHPGFVRASRSRSELENQSDSVLLTLEMVDKLLALALPVGSTKDHRYTCPMGIGEEEIRALRLPPLFVGVAEGDLMRDTNLEYCEAMKRGGKEVVVHVSRGVGHAFYMNCFAVESDPITRTRTDELVLAIKDFVDHHHG